MINNNVRIWYTTNKKEISSIHPSLEEIKLNYLNNEIITSPFKMILDNNE